MAEKKKPAPTPLIVSYLEKVLLLLCVSVRPEYEKYVERYFYLYAVFIYGVNFVLYIIYAFTKADSYSLLVMSSLFINGSTFLYLILVSVRLSRDYFLKCYQNVLPDGKYVGEAFYIITHQETINKVKLLFIWLSILMAGMTVNPLMAATLSDSELGSLDTLIAPHAYPWNMSTVRGYIITMIYQAGFCTIAMSPSGTMSIFILLNWIAIKGQYEVLKRRIAALDDVMEGFAVGDDHTVVQRSNSYHRVMMDELAAVIEHYRHLKEISDDFIHAIRRSVSLSIFSFFSISVLLISSLILIEASFFGKTKWLNLLLVSLAFFVIKCNVGEYLNELNDEVMFLLYSTKWFEQSIPYRKRMTTFFILLQNPLRIQFMGTYDINLALLMSLMQKVYAGIQVLLTVSKQSSEFTYTATYLTLMLDKLPM